MAIAFSRETGCLFFSNARPNAIYSASGDEQPTQVAAKIISHPAQGVANGLFVDDSTAKIYFADREYKKLCRANFDGTQIEDVVVGLIQPFDVKLDVDGKMIYWGDTRNLKRCKLPRVREKISMRTPPFVERISPASASVDDVITIEGKNLAETVDVQFIETSKGESAIARFSARRHGALGHSAFDDGWKARRDSSS